LPTTKTAEKEMRTAERRKERNKAYRSLSKTKITAAEKMISAGNLDAAQAEVKNAISVIDREAERSKVHRNNAARHKSRLVKKLNKLSAAKKETK